MSKSSVTKSQEHIKRGDSTSPSQRIPTYKEASNVTIRDLPDSFYKSMEKNDRKRKRCTKCGRIITYHKV